MFALTEKQILQRDAAAGPARHVLGFGGSRCVAGDTVLDGHTRTIKELADVGEPVPVLTTHGVQWAEAPFKKGTGLLFRVVLDSGKAVEVTDDHRFWNGTAWVRTFQLSPGALIAVRTSAHSLPLTNSERGLSELPLGVPCCSRKPGDCPGGCCACRNLCDPQPLLCEASGLACRASLSDAPGHSHANPLFEERESDTHGGRPQRPESCDTPNDHVSSRPTKTGAYPSTYPDVESSSPASARTSEQFPGLRQDDSQSPPLCDLSLSILQQVDSWKPQCFSHESLPPDTPLFSGYKIERIRSITASAVQDYYTLHVPHTEQYFANGILHHNSGKTFGFVRCMVARALQAPESRHLIARRSNIDVRQAVMMDTFPKVMRLAYPGIPYTVNKQDQYAKFGNDAEIWFGGLDDKERVEKILGKEFATIYVNEASQIAYDTITTLRTRLAQQAGKVDGRRLQLKMYYDLNPTGRSHWSYKEFVAGIRPDTKRTFDNSMFTWLQMNPTDNPYLPKEYLEELAMLPERQRLRFLEGVYQSEVPGSLWPEDRIASARVSEYPQLQRIIIGVDPSGGGDSQGIVAVGEGIDGHAYVLEDATCNLSPAGWGARVVDLYDKWRADCIVAERNYGGDMVESTIRTVSRDVKIKMVSATRGKHVRAEPVAALYEPRADGAGSRVHHVGTFEDLEDQMQSFTTSGYVGSDSPDRADALIWALTELMLNKEGYTFEEMRRFYA